MHSEEMIIPKKQMAVAVLVIIALIVVSGLWIVYSNHGADGANKIPDLDDSNSNNFLPENKIPFVKIIILEKNDCVECVSLDPLADSIKAIPDLNVLEVKRIDSNSAEAQDIIKMHSITKLPSLIVNGEFQGTVLEEQWFLFGEEKNGVLIGNLAPYYSLTEERVVGYVDFVLVQNSSCVECLDLNYFLDILDAYGIAVRSQKVIEYDSEEGKAISENYLIDRVPLVFIKGDISEYTMFSLVWSEAGGAVESDGVYSFREAVPYFDVLSGETKGLVTVTKLIDQNCFDCLDVNELVEPLNLMGVTIVKEETFDVSSPEAKNLIEKYEITKIPTIIVSSDAEEYLDFFVAWPEVGTQEEDNNFVFRNLEVLGQKFITLE
jgi:glutaredoxin